MKYRKGDFDSEELCDDVKRPNVECWGNELLKLPKFSNLRNVANAIQGKAEYRRVGTAIEKLARAQSCIADLSEAIACCEAIEELRGSNIGRGTFAYVATEAALLRTAVTLYERSTAAGAKQGERGSIQIAAHLNSEQLNDHETLVLLRQRSLVHVYMGEEIDGDIWHKGLLFAVEAGSAWRPAVASHRIQFHTPTFERLRRQLPVAKDIVFVKFQKRFDKLTTILHENPIPNAIFENNSLDPLKAFGSFEAVKSVLDGQETGQISFVG